MSDKVENQDLTGAVSAGISTGTTQASPVGPPESTGELGAPVEEVHGSPTEGGDEAAVPPSREESQTKRHRSISDAKPPNDSAEDQEEDDLDENDPIKRHFAASQFADELIDMGLFHTDLHAHLLGCGDYNFWYEEIMRFYLRRKYNLPVMFDKERETFLTVSEVRSLLDPQHLKGLFLSEPSWTGSQKHYFEEVRKDKPKFQKYLEDCERDIAVELDVVFSVEKLGQAFCLDKYPDDVLISYVCERLQCKPSDILEHLIFDARNQQFRWLRGIPNDHLVGLCETSDMARAFIKNGFSMLSPSGGPPRLEDLIPYRGHFTPEFFPGRFALKDPIYSQRLDVLLRLLEHIRKRCQLNKVPVEYMELSIGMGDASRKHVMAFLSPRLRSRFSLLKGLEVQLHPEEDKPRNQKEARRKDHPVVFKYLVGVNRQEVSLPLASPDLRKIGLQLLPGSTKIASTREGILSWELMMHYPNRCIRLFLKGYREPDPGDDFKGIFENMYSTLRTFESCWFPDHERHVDQQTASPRLGGADETQKNEDLVVKKLHDTDIVGFDLFGDEFAAPYCPFPSRRFMKYAKSLGFRIHFGESHPLVPPDSGSFIAWLTHMLIGLLAMYRMSAPDANAKIRVGHGVSLKELFNSSLGMHAETKPGSRVLYRHCLLLAESLWPSGLRHRKSAQSAIPIEINLTSNEYLLPETQNAQEVLRAFHDRKVTHFLSTDDEGVWPIDGNPKNNFCIGLHGEYVMAIKQGLISKEAGIKMVKNAEEERFFPWSYEQSSVEPSGRQPDTSPRVAPAAFASKILLDPQRIQVLSGNGAIAARVNDYVTESCPWVNCASNFTYPVAPAPRSDEEETKLSVIASSLLEQVLFKIWAGPEEKKVVDVFERLVTKLCRFKQDRPIEQFRKGATEIIWMTVNQCTRDLFKSLLSVLHKQREDYKERTVQLKLFIEREECLAYVKDVLQDRRWSEGWMTTEFYICSLCSQKDVPQSWTKKFIQPFPSEMSAFPLFYHAGIIPYLAEWVDANKDAIGKDELKPVDGVYGEKVDDEETAITSLLSFPLLLPVRQEDGSRSGIGICKMNPDVRVQFYKEGNTAPILPPLPSLNFPSNYWTDVAAKHYASLLYLAKPVAEYIELDYRLQNAEPNSWLIPPLVLADEGKQRYLYASKLKNEQRNKSAEAIFELIRTGLKGTDHENDQILVFLVSVLRSFLDRFTEASHEVALAFLKRCWEFANSDVGYSYTTVERLIGPLMEVTLQFFDRLPRHQQVQAQKDELRQVVREALSNKNNWKLGNGYQYGVWKRLPAGTRLLSFVQE